MRTKAAVALFGLFALVAASLAVAAPAAHAAPAAPSCASLGYTVSPQDIDADGASDLVEGVPGAADAGKAGAGVVDIHYALGRSDTAGANRTQRFGSGFMGIRAAANNRFGAAVAYAETNSDYCRELVIGAPGVDGGRGAVVIAPGSSTGTLNTGTVRLNGQFAGEHFGAVIAVAGRDRVHPAMNDSDLWVSAPDRAVAGHPAAGAVDHYQIGSDGSIHLLQRITEDSPNVPGVAEAYDHFGSVISADPSGRLYLGEPYEDVGGARDAGTVSILTTSETTGLVTGGHVISQNSPGISGHAEAGDHFGAALSATGESQSIDPGQSPTLLFAGAPDEAIGSVRHAGIVYDFELAADWTPVERRTITEDSAGVPGAVEEGDRFGASLLTGGWMPCQINPILLAIGAPGESIGTRASAGAVTVLPARPDASDPPNQTCTAYRQGAAGISGSPESGDRFGASLSELANPYQPNFGFGHVFGGGKLLVGVPGEDLGTAADAGAVQLLDVRAGPGGSFSSTSLTRYDSAGIAEGESYGAAPAWSVPNLSCFC